MSLIVVLGTVEARAVGVITGTGDFELEIRVDLGHG
jgi:hypothetical protein